MEDCEGVANSFGDFPRMASLCGDLKMFHTVDSRKPMTAVLFLQNGLEEVLAEESVGGLVAPHVAAPNVDSVI